MKLLLVEFVGLVIALCFLQAIPFNEVRDNQAYRATIIESAINDTAVLLGYADLRLVSLKKENSCHISDSELKSIGCVDWELNQSDLDGILESMRKVEPVEWNAICYHYPCYYSGLAENDGATYELHVNAASYIRLTNPNNGEELIFVWEGEDDSPFLEACDCCE